MVRVIGVGAAAFGGLILLYVYAHAQMIDPALGESERRALLLEKMFLQSGMCEATYVAFGLIAGGLWLARSQDWCGPGRRNLPTHRLRESGYRRLRRCRSSCSCTAP
jgi:hypothetical protein